MIGGLFCFHRVVRSWLHTGGWEVWWLWWGEKKNDEKRWLFEEKRKPCWNMAMV